MIAAGELVCDTIYSDTHVVCGDMARNNVWDIVGVLVFDILREPSPLATWLVEHVILAAGGVLAQNVWNSLIAMWLHELQANVARIIKVFVWHETVI